MASPAIAAINRSFQISARRSFVNSTLSRERLNEKSHRNCSRGIEKAFVLPVFGHALSLQKFELLMQKLSSDCAKAKENINRSTCGIPRGHSPREETTGTGIDRETRDKEQGRKDTRNESRRDEREEQEEEEMF